jgi:nucleoid DNA-binding protein
MDKKEFVKILAERTKSSQKDSRIVIDSVFSIIIEKLSN